MIVFEITNKYVKAVWGKSTLKKMHISGMVIKPLTSDSQEEAVKIISSIVDEKMIKKYKPFVLCIPRNQVIVRNLKFPSKDSEELESIINLHITQEVPYSRDEIIHDYMILERTSTGFANVLLSIIHRRILIKQLSAFKRLNLYPDNILLSTLGLLEFLHKAKVTSDGDTDVRACIDIGDEFTDFFLFKGNKILFSKGIDVGSAQLKDEGRLTSFMAELKQSMTVFRTSNREDISSIYVSGLKDKNDKLEKNIKETFHLQAKTVDPLNVIGTLNEVKEIDEIISEVSVSAILGIALKPMSKKLKFVLPEEKQRKIVRDMARNLFITGGITIYLIVLMLVGFMGNIYSKQLYLNKLSTKIGELEGVNENAIKALKKIKTVENFTRDKESFLYYYYELTKVVPKNITIDRLNFRKKKELSMMGKGTDMGEIFKFVRQLNSIKIFGKVELRYSRKTIKEEEEYSEFNIVSYII